MKRIQEFEFETNCKELDTALRRFAKKFPEVSTIWGEHLRYLVENGLDHDDGRKEAGYFVNAIDGDGYFYFDIQIYNEQQVIAC